jgi:hypothetical protein
MNIHDRIEAFAKLGNYLSAIDEAELHELILSARNENAWFTEESIKLALEGIKSYLEVDSLRNWASHYRLRANKPRTVAVIMAGNIPLVGFHDFLSVIISGHSLQAKLSSKDSVLMKFLAEKLVELTPELGPRIQFTEQLKNFDAVIATGSDNSARYFHYYFGKYPHIIRKNRASCAVLTGRETDEELRRLGADVFSYFGLGCRNVSKIYLPKDADPTRMLPCWNSFHPIIHHHKYHNNYDYQKSILLVNRMPFLEDSFVLLQESEKLVSPISVVYYEFYENEGSLALSLTRQKDKIQCIVGRSTPGSIPFGQAQYPTLLDYADHVDTLKFLDELI